MKTFETTPKNDGFFMPAEFEKHSGTWMLWPERTDIWRLGAKPVQIVFSKIANTIARYEEISVGVSASQYEHARNMLIPEVRVVELSFDDAWVRDNGPTFLVNGRKELRGVDWFFNAWGGVGEVENAHWNLAGSYFPWKLDDMVARKILEIEKAGRYRCPLIIEGGALHVDGNGTLIAIKECILGRNSKLSFDAVSELLKTYLGIKNIIWLEQGLYLEENNGHIDNMCCFVNDSTILLNWCDDTSDPQYEISKTAYNTLLDAENSIGDKYNVIKIAQPSVITITEEESSSVDSSEYAIPRLAGDRLPASYINSYILNGAVLIPSFASHFDESPARNDEAAYKIYCELFPERTVIQIPSRELLLGGGGIHCILQQVPQHQ